MDRLNQARWPRVGLGIGVGLTLALLGTGCRHTRPEVPPERPYLRAPGSSGMTAAPEIGFSSEPATGAYAGAVPATPSGVPGYGTQAPAYSPATPAAPPGMGGSSVPPGMTSPPRGVMGDPTAPPSPL